MKENLSIKILKYIAEHNGEYKPIEVKEFLLKKFKKTSEFTEQKEIKTFITFLEKSDLIEVETRDGLSFTVEAGRTIKRDDISVKIKITSKGFALLSEHNKNKINNTSILINIFFGFLTICFAVWGLNLNNTQNIVKSDIQNLKDDISHLKLELYKSYCKKEHTKRQQDKK